LVDFIVLSCRIRELGTQMSRMGASRQQIIRLIEGFLRRSGLAHKDVYDMLMDIIMMSRVSVEESLSNRDTEHTKAEDPRRRVPDIGTVRQVPIPSADIFH
jgi:hypothetical protein